MIFVEKPPGHSLDQTGRFSKASLDCVSPKVSTCSLSTDADLAFSIELGGIRGCVHLQAGVPLDGTCCLCRHIQKEPLNMCLLYIAI